MAIDTFSKFYFDYDVDDTNKNLNFNEGAGELKAVVAIKSYTLDELPLAIKTAMDAVGTLVYTVSVDRTTRVFTISSTASFDLLITSGLQVGTGIFSTIGFTGADLTGLSTYSGNNSAGKEYKVQFKLQDYIAPNFAQERIQPSVNESASGNIEVVSFGIRKFIEMNLLYITNLQQDGHFIRNKTTGVEDAIEFLEFATSKAPLEFMPDEDDPATFFKVLLESTASDSNGIGFLLREETGKNLRDMFQTGRLRWRIVEN